MRAEKRQKLSKTNSLCLAFTKTESLILIFGGEDSGEDSRRNIMCSSYTLPFLSLLIGGISNLQSGDFFAVYRFKAYTHSAIILKTFLLEIKFFELQIHNVAKKKTFQILKKPLANSHVSNMHIYLNYARCNGRSTKNQ